MTHIYIAFAVVTGLSYPSQPVQFQFLGHASGSVVRICLDRKKVKQTFAGKLALRTQGRTVTSVCGDVRTPLRTKQVFWARIQPTTRFGHRERLAGSIVATHFHLAKSDQQCAGLQLAVWEALEDGGTSPDFRSGRFQAEAADDVMLYAAQYYQVQRATKIATVIESPGKVAQSQLLPSQPVPNGVTGHTDG